MGVFLGYGDTGVWASNRERNAFLDWYAYHRCDPDDKHWKYCKSEGNRWTGCCLDFNELTPKENIFEVTDKEIEIASKEYWPDLALLLNIVSQITKGVWQHRVGSKEAEGWRNGQPAVQL